MTPKEIQTIQDIRAGLDSGLLTPATAHALLVENLPPGSPNPLLVLSSWGHALQDTSILTEKVDVAMGDHLATSPFTSLPDVLRTPVDTFNQQVAAGGLGGIQQGELTPEQVAQQREFSFGRQFQQFQAAQGPQTEVQRRAFGRQQAPLTTAFELQRLADLAGGTPAEEQGTFLSFLQGQPSAQGVTQSALDALRGAVGAGAGQTEFQQAAIERADEQARALIPGILSQGVQPTFREAVENVSQRRITGEEAFRIAATILGPSTLRGPGTFESFLGQKGLPTTNIENLSGTLRSAFVPGQEGFSGLQETGQTLLDERGVPIIRELVGGGAPGYIRDALNRVLTRRIGAFQAKRPGANVFGEFIAGGGLGFAR